MRLIDADVIDKKVSDAYDTWTDDTEEHVVARNLLKSTRKFLLELSSIDIVRCKECKWAEPNREGDYDCKCHIPTFRIKANDYCSYGEREAER